MNRRRLPVIPGQPGILPDPPWPAGGQRGVLDFLDAGAAIDVVQVNLVDSSMFDPIWSPDGKTLIVFGGYGPKPYAIDIASYLASKGLQP